MKNAIYLFIFWAVAFSSLAASKLQKVEHIMRLMDTEHELQEQLVKIAENLKPYSKIQDEDRFKEIMNQILNVDDLLDYQKKQYMTQFNESELNDIIAFYQSQGGKRLKRINPQIFSDSMQYAHQMIQKKLHLLKN